MAGVKNYYVFTTHKAASRFIDSLLKDVAIGTGLALHAPGQPGFPREKELEGDPSKLTCSGLIGTLRYGFLPLDLKASEVIVHLRDPRDVLVSLYFSHKYSHRRGDGGFNPTPDIIEQIDLGVDNYVLYRAPQYLERYEFYTEKMLNLGNVKLSSYEEMVLNFADWLPKFVENFPLLDREAFIAKQIHKRAKQFELDGAEDVMAHKRKVTPGDHKEKLEPATIAKLNQIFGNTLDVLNYEV
ncbi:sulfotransferase domain-containing protein [Maricaulis salignorans]|uniref:sulfotransferase domain-containing protein n=1 Tax=Maricaulis salignorans TaxID=144026 RepID=UPI003A92EDBF